MNSIQKILSIKNKNEWRNIIHKYFPKYDDIYFDPDYVKLDCLAKKNSQGFLYYFKKKEKIWINIFIKIKTPIYSKNIKDIYYDIETPYGYGGPLTNTNDKHFIFEACKSFQKWLKKNLILANLYKYHPLIKNYETYDQNTKLFKSKITCSIDLNLVDKNLSPFKSKIKNMIRNAKKNKLSIKISKDYKDFEYFEKIYLKSMKQKKANKKLFFNKFYFLSLYRLITKSGFILLVLEKKSKIAAGIFLFGKNFLHYHLSASDPQKNKPGTFNLMLFEAALYGKKLGLNNLHLGGGNSNKIEDNLLKFKLSMSTNIHQFYIGENVINKYLYKLNIEGWEKKFERLKEIHKNKFLRYHFNN